MPKKTTLPNGIRVLSDRVAGVRSVSVGVWAAVGSRDETAGQGGLAHLIEHMMFKGTTRRSARVIAETIDATGGMLDAYTTKEATAYYARVLDEHMPVALDLLADMLINSTFAEEELAREKEVVLEEISMAEDMPEDLVHELFDAHVFAGHPLARPILGTRESVAGHTREDILRFVGRHYRPANLVIAAAGSVDHGRLVDEAARLFGGMSGPEPPRRVTRPLAYTPGRVAVEKDTEQVHVCVGGPGVRRADPRRFAMHLLDTIVGGGMSSRLFQQLRENRGLVYSTYSFVASYTETGVFGVYAATRPERVEEVLEVIGRELGEMAAGGIREEDVDRAREHAKGSLMLALENTATRVGRLAGAELWREPYLSPGELIDRIERVSVQDVRALADELFAPERLSVVMLGPVAAEKPAPVRRAAAAGRRREAAREAMG